MEGGCLTLCLVECNFPFTACHLPSRLCPKLYQVLRPARSLFTKPTLPPVGFERNSFYFPLTTSSQYLPTPSDQSLPLSDLYNSSPTTPSKGPVTTSGLPLRHKTVSLLPLQLYPPGQVRHQHRTSKSKSRFTVTMPVSAGPSRWFKPENRNVSTF